MALETVVEANLGNNRKAPTVMLGVRGINGESYMLTFDHAKGAAYIPTRDSHSSNDPLPVILTDGVGTPYVASFSFLRNGTPVQAAFDSAAPENNRAVPVLPLSGDGSAPAAFGAGNASAATQRVVIAADQAATLGTEATLLEIASKVGGSTASPGRSVIDSLVYAYASQGATLTAALTLESGATALAADAHKISVFDDSGEVLILAWASGTPDATHQIRIPPGGGDFDVKIPSGSPIRIAAKSGTISGKIVINFLGINS